MTLTHFLLRWIFRVSLWVLILLIPMQPFSVAFGALPFDCTDKLTEAQKLYLEGQFNASLLLLEDCLKQADLPKAQKELAYELQAENYHAKTEQSDADKAEEAIISLLNSNWDYVPGPGVKQSFVELVNKVRERMKPLAADMDNDGVPDDKDKCPETPSGTAVNAEGCPPEPSKDGSWLDDLQWYHYAGTGAVLGVGAWLIFRPDEKVPPPTNSNLPGPPVLPDN